MKVDLHVPMSSIDALEVESEDDWLPRRQQPTPERPEGNQRLKKVWHFFSRVIHKREEERTQEGERAADVVTGIPAASVPVVVTKRKRRTSAIPTTYLATQGKYLSILDEDFDVPPSPSQSPQSSSTQLLRQADTDPAIVELCGATGGHTYLNAVFKKQKEKSFGRSSYRSKKKVAKGHGILSGRRMWLYFVSELNCWAISFSLGTTDGVWAVLPQPTLSHMRRGWRVVHEEAKFEDVDTINRLISLPSLYVRTGATPTKKRERKGEREKVEKRVRGEVAPAA